MAHLTSITNTPRNYAWGKPGGIATALGQPPTDEPEAEFWLGAHSLSPSRAIDPTDWRDLAQWQESTGRELGFLLKLLAAAAPLSLQAHPNPQQARAGYAREEAAGLAATDPTRNYKDPHAKPELVVALEDGYEALCGFRPVSETLAFLDRLPDVPGVQTWRRRLGGPGGLKAALDWLLSDDAEVAELVSGLTAQAALRPDELGLVNRLASFYPGDHGIAVAQLLNHVVLAKGEALWLPAGNIHAYLQGLGVELMGPSDNVLRGGLTPKHVDSTELLAILDFTTGHPPRLAPVELAPNVVTYRPATMPSGAGIPFELLNITGPATVRLASASVGLVTSGFFTAQLPDDRHDLARGAAFFIDDASTLTLNGTGEIFIAQSAN